MKRQELDLTRELQQAHKQVAKRTKLNENVISILHGNSHIFSQARIRSIVLSVMTEDPGAYAGGNPATTSLLREQGIFRF